MFGSTLGAKLTVRDFSQCIVICFCVRHVSYVVCRIHYTTDVDVDVDVDFVAFTGLGVVLLDGDEQVTACSCKVGSIRIEVDGSKHDGLYNFLAWGLGDTIR